MFARIHQQSHLVLGFCFLGDFFFFITVSISVLVIGLFIISISSWFSLGRLKFSKNLHFFRIIYFIAIWLFIIGSYNPLYFSIVCCKLCFFISNYVDLILLSFFLMSLTSSIQFSHSVVSDSLQSHGLQHTRLPCPSPTPKACLNSCPSSW